MKRTAYFDNAKAILIYLVVLGHLMSGYLNENQYVDTLYLVIYLFHMPAFILIAGHFSRKIKSLDDLKKLVKTLVLPYVIFQILYTLYYRNVFGDHVQFEFFEPRYALWFLLSMIMWKMMLWVFSSHKGMIVVSIIVSLLVGYMSEVNEWLSLSRTFFFFPFFLMGYYLNRENFVKMKNKWNVRVASMLASTLIVVVYLYGDVRWKEWFFGRVPYEDIGYGLLESSVLSRLFIYVLMIVSTYIFLSLVPTENQFYTNIGGKTLGVYLLHLFIIRAFKETDIYVWIEDTGNYVALFAIAFLIVYVLSSNWVWKVTAPLIMVNRKS
ncbi:acyltransferase family protein [Lysinibacillus sp. KU-BSD001]|uniref:acyltransferase family protein n=1 Tax=Lysinibacillus sp. KU-BSD001 TaxID=3141328 RepID=UPI0036EE6C19